MAKKRYEMSAEEEDKLERISSLLQGTPEMDAKIKALKKMKWKVPTSKIFGALLAAIASAAGMPPAKAIDLFKPKFDLSPKEKAARLASLRAERQGILKAMASTERFKAQILEGQVTSEARAKQDILNQMGLNLRHERKLWSDESKARSDIHAKHADSLRKQRLQLQPVDDLRDINASPLIGSTAIDLSNRYGSMVGANEPNGNEAWWGEVFKAQQRLENEPPGAVPLMMKELERRMGWKRGDLGRMNEAGARSNNWPSARSVFNNTKRHESNRKKAESNVASLMADEAEAYRQAARIGHGGKQSVAMEALYGTMQSLERPEAGEEGVSIEEDADGMKARFERSLEGLEGEGSVDEMYKAELDTLKSMEMALEAGVGPRPVRKMWKDLENEPENLLLQKQLSAQLGYDLTARDVLLLRFRERRLRKKEEEESSKTNLGKISRWLKNKPNANLEEVPSKNEAEAEAKAQTPTASTPVAHGGSPSALIVQGADPLPPTKEEDQNAAPTG